MPRTHRVDVPFSVHPGLALPSHAGIPVHCTLRVQGLVVLYIVAVNPPRKCFLWFNNGVLHSLRETTRKNMSLTQPVRFLTSQSTEACADSGRA